jgi:hypothetical protein
LEFDQKIVQKNSESGTSRNSEKPTAEERGSCVIWRGVWNLETSITEGNLCNNVENVK